MYCICSYLPASPDTHYNCLCVSLLFMMLFSPCLLPLCVRYVECHRQSPSTSTGGGGRNTLVQVTGCDSNVRACQTESIVIYNSHVM